MGISCFIRGLGQLNATVISDSFADANKQYFKDSFWIECKKNKAEAVWGFFLPATEKPLLVFTFKSDKLDWDGKQSDTFVWWCNLICASVIAEKTSLKIEMDSGSKLKSDFHLKYPVYSKYVDEEASMWNNPEEAKARLMGQAKNIKT